MKLATKPVTIGGRPGKPAAYETIKGKGVTGFMGFWSSMLAFLGSILFSFGMIAIDGILLSTVSNSASSIATDEAHAGDKTRLNNTLYALLAFDVVVLITQAIDLYFFHFKVWALTAVTWAGQLFALALTGALTGATMLSSQSLGDDTSLLYDLSIGSAFMHALFTASQFSVTLEYLMRAVS